VPIAVAQDHVLFQRLEIDQFAYVATRVLDGSLDLALLQLVSLDLYAGGPKAVPTSFERSVGIAIVLQILLEVGVVVEGHAVAHSGRSSPPTRLTYDSVEPRLFPHWEAHFDGSWEYLEAHVSPFFFGTQRRRARLEPDEPCFLHMKFCKRDPFAF
jgi:hypothetical protein